MHTPALWAHGKTWFAANTRALRAAALGVALAAAVPGLVACSSNEVENDGSIRGTLAVYIATMNDGTSRTEYHLRVAGTEEDERMLVFADAPPDLASDTEIKVWGASGREII